MRCAQCGGSWTAPENSTRPLQKCPFCGAALERAEKRELTSAEAVLREIADRFGVETLGEGQKLVALFSDLSPQMTRERFLLTYLVQSGGNRLLLEARGLPEKERQARLLQASRRLVEERAVDRAAAAMICGSFSLAIGLGAELPEEAAGQERETVQPRKEAAGQGRETVQSPRETAQPRREAASSPRTEGPSSAPIDTFEKYQAALEAYFLRLGGVPLTEEQIRVFLKRYDLERMWKITVSDVQQDLKDIYARSAARAEPAGQAAARQSPVLTFPVNRQIRTYESYKKELEQAFLRKGKTMLTQEEMRRFLSAYGLDRTYGIRVRDVEMDLREIAKQYS